MGMCSACRTFRVSVRRIFGDAKENLCGPFVLIIGWESHASIRLVESS